MDQLNQNWVSKKIHDMRDSAYFVSKIDDGFYETVPIPHLESLRQVPAMTILFGRHRSIPSPGPAILNARPLTPVYACDIAFPDGDMTWRSIGGEGPAQFLSQPPEGPRPQSQGITKCRRNYYQALSRFFEAQPLTKPKEMVTDTDLDIVRSLRDLLVSATNPWLDSLNNEILQSLDNWISKHLR